MVRECCLKWWNYVCNCWYEFVVRVVTTRTLHFERPWLEDIIAASTLMVLQMFASIANRKKQSHACLDAWYLECRMLGSSAWILRRQMRFSENWCPGYHSKKPSEAHRQSEYACLSWKASQSRKGTKEHERFNDIWNPNIHEHSKISTSVAVTQTLRWSTGCCLWQAVELQGHGSSLRFGEGG